MREDSCHLTLRQIEKKKNDLMICYKKKEKIKKKGPIPRVEGPPSRCIFFSRFSLCARERQRVSKPESNHREIETSRGRRAEKGETRDVCALRK